MSPMEYERLRSLIYGEPGRFPGIEERTRTNEAAIDAMQANVTSLGQKVDGLKDSVDALVESQKLDKARQDGRLDTLAWLKWAVGLILALLTIGGILGAWQLDSKWDTLQQQIQRIPAVPE